MGFIDCEIWLKNVPDCAFNTDIGTKKLDFSCKVSQIIDLSLWQAAVVWPWLVKVPSQ